MQSYLHEVVSHAGHCANREFAELPPICPFCKQHGQPFRLTARSTDADDTSVDFVFQCSRPDCRRVFVASYQLGPNGEFELDRVDAERWQDRVLTRHA